MFIKKYYTLVSVLCLPLLLASCAKKINISHASFAHKKAIPCGFPLGSSFSIESVDQNDAMIEQDITNKIEFILYNKGYTIQEADYAHYHILFKYQIDQTQKTEYVVTYVPDKVINSSRNVIRNGRSKLCQERIETPGKFVTVPEMHTYFTKSIVIQVFESQESLQESPRLIWQGSATYCDESDDLRDALNYLLVTSLRDFGIDTHKNIQTTISSDDKDIVRLHNN